RRLRFRLLLNLGRRLLVLLLFLLGRFVHLLGRPHPALQLHPAEEDEERNGDEQEEVPGLHGGSTAGEKHRDQRRQTYDRLTLLVPESFYGRVQGLASRSKA